jgi:hypothetical protein
MAHLPRPILHRYPTESLRLTFNPLSNNITRLSVITEVHCHHDFRCPSPINIIILNREASTIRCVDGHLWLMLKMPPSILWYASKSSFFCKWNCVVQLTFILTDAHSCCCCNVQCQLIHCTCLSSRSETIHNTWTSFLYVYNNDQDT